LFDYISGVGSGGASTPQKFWCEQQAHHCMTL